MAFSRSLFESGHDEVRDDDVVTDICSYCATNGKLQPALHFCFDCGVFGRYICGMCLKNHNLFVNNHEVERIANQSTSRRKKENDSKIRALQQSNGELQKYNSNLQKENAELLDNINDVIKENEKLAKELHDFKEANNGLKTKIEEYEHESKKKENRLTDVVKERDDYIAKLRENDTKVKSLMTSNEKLQWDKSSLETDRVKLLTNVDEVKEENENLAKELHHYKVEKMDQTKAKVLSNIVSARELRVKDNRKLSVSMCVGGARLSKKNKLLVAAIVIGESSSAYASSFRQDDPLNIYFNQRWVAGSMSLMSIKTPTVVLFDVNKKFHLFGYEAESKYAELADDGNHHEWYFFRRFMSTLQEEKIDINYLIADDKGKEIKFIDVLSAVIKYLKDHLLQLLERKGTGIRIKDVHLVIPVPAIWTETANQIMREAAYKADINSADLTLVSEPVAASLYCQMIPTEKLRCSKSVKYPAKLLSSPGQKFMVIDLGGYSAGFTILERQSDGGLMVAATGVGCGANMVYSEFLAFFRNILSDAIYQKCIDDSMYDYIELQREFDTKIRAIKPDFNGKVTIKVEPSFGDSFKKMKGETIQDHIERSQYKGKVRWLPDKVRIDAEMLKDMFKPCTDMIVGYIQELLKYKDVQGTGIFLMVGGFSESLMVQEAVIKAFPNVNVFVPEKAGCAVMNGAVIYGHQH